MGLLLSFRRGIGLFRTNGVFVVHHLAPFYRPRDILQALDILAKLHLNSNRSEEVFEYSELFAAEFRRQYGDYLVGEIKDCLSFYYDEHEFQTFLDFFTFMVKINLRIRNISMPMPNLPKHANQEEDHYRRL